MNTTYNTTTLLVLFVLLSFKSFALELNEWSDLRTLGLEQVLESMDEELHDPVITSGTIPGKGDVVCLAVRICINTVDGYLKQTGFAIMMGTLEEISGGTASVHRVSVPVAYLQIIYGNDEFAVLTRDALGRDNYTMYLRFIGYNGGLTVSEPLELLRDSTWFDADYGFSFARTTNTYMIVTPGLYPIFVNEDKQVRKMDTNFSNAGYKRYTTAVAMDECFLFFYRTFSDTDIYTQFITSPYTEILSTVSAGRTASFLKSTAYAPVTKHAAVFLYTKHSKSLLLQRLSLDCTNPGRLKVHYNSLSQHFAIDLNSNNVVMAPSSHEKLDFVASVIRTYRTRRTVLNSITSNNNVITNILPNEPYQPVTQDVAWISRDGTRCGIGVVVTQGQKTVSIFFADEQYLCPPPPPSTSSPISASTGAPFVSPSNVLSPDAVQTRSPSVQPNVSNSPIDSSVPSEEPTTNDTPTSTAVILETKISLILLSVCLIICLLLQAM